MVFESLSLDLQNILLQNYYTIGKLFILFFIFSISILYLFVIKEQQKKTDSLSKIVLRIFAFGFSWTNLILFFPIFIFFTSPDLSLWNVFSIYFAIYILIIGVVSVTAVLDTFNIGLKGILIKMGINQDSPEAKKLIRKIEKDRLF